VVGLFAIFYDAQLDEVHLEAVLRAGQRYLVYPLVAVSRSLFVGPLSAVEQLAAANPFDIDVRLVFAELSAWQRKTRNPVSMLRRCC
jgi:hypothetical protein